MEPENGAHSSADVGEGEDEGSTREGREEGGARNPKKWWSRLWGVLFPQLSLHDGCDVLSPVRSTVVVGILYASHTLSAWGDRMWGFAVPIFFALLYPGSLLLPGIYGFLMQLSVAVFGTVVGDWVDVNPRMKVIWMSLLIQNTLVALCAVVLALMFNLEWDVCHNLVVFSCLTVLVVLLGSGASLATVANTISIEKDWVVVLADKNKETLAALNASMRRIDLLCKLLAPASTGILLYNTGPFATTIIVAGWNVVSFFGELGLLWQLYRMIPTLAVKKYRKPAVDVEMQKDQEETLELEDENGSSATDKQNEEGGDPLEDDKTFLTVQPQKKTLHGSPMRKVGKFCSRLLSPFTIIRNGWKIYMRQEIVLVGFALASLYLTVLGFSGVTATYFLSQGLRNDLIGVSQGIGAVFGVTGTIFYPFIRKKVGTTRAGLFGICAQWFMILFCLLAVLLPVQRFANNAEFYYSADCSDHENHTNLTILPSVCTFPTPSSMLVPAATPHLKPSYSYTTAKHRMTSSKTLFHSLTSASGTYASMASLTAMPSRSSSNSSAGSTYASMASLTAMPSRSSSNSSAGSTYASMASVTAMPSRYIPSPVAPSSASSYLLPSTPRQWSPITEPLTSSQFLLTPSPRERRKRFARAASPIDSTNTPVLPSECVPLVSNTPLPTNASLPTPHVSVTVVLMLIGVIGARFGLWMFDLTVTQLVQEKVVEEERGVVSGVMNAMNSVMNMLQYVMVIVAPRPEHFRYLTIVSVCMVTLGAVLYACYVRKVRGHLFHFRDSFHRLKKQVSKKGFQVVSQSEEAEEEEEEGSVTTSLVNVMAQEDVEGEVGGEDGAVTSTSESL